VLKEGAPILLKFVTQVAARLRIGGHARRLPAQALPVVGAPRRRCGELRVHRAFPRDVARGHFTVRRLERIYGKEKIRFEYDLIARQL